MRIAIQQPEHMPWVGFFDKMTKCDEYVLLDNVQFKKRYFENRNKIRTPDGSRWICVPVKTKGKYHQRIDAVEIDNETDWRETYLGLVAHHYRRAKNFDRYFEAFREIVRRDNIFLVDLNIALIEWVRRCLDIQPPLKRASEIRDYQVKGSDLILEICKDRKADVYISGPDGRNYLDIEQFKAAGIDLEYHDYQHPVYTQMHDPFVPYMSILDFLFNEGPNFEQNISHHTESQAGR